jgi:hypothetical protein
MARWEYAIFSNPASGDDGIRFSHGQKATIVQDAASFFGRGLKAEHSNNLWLHINLNNTKTTNVCGFLGDRGWELAGYSTLTGGHEYFIFKRQLSDAPPKV